MPYDMIREPDESNVKYLDSMYIDDPWRNIVWDAHNKLVQIDPAYSIVQVKPKFRRLRFYYTPSQPQFKERMDAVIEEAEAAVDKLENAKSIGARSLNL
jgi:hypothetical protein